MKKDLLTVKELAAELRMSPKSIQRAYTVMSEKRANGGTSETGGIVGLVCLVHLVDFVCLVVSFIHRTNETNETNKTNQRNQMNQRNQRNQMNKSDERPEAWRVKLKKEEGRPMRLRRFSRLPGLLRGLLLRLSLAGEL